MPPFVIMQESYTLTLRFHLTFMAFVSVCCMHKSNKKANLAIYKFRMGHNTSQSDPTQFVLVLISIVYKFHFVVAKSSKIVEKSISPYFFQ